MRSVILTTALLLATHAHADKWDLMVCDAFTDPAEKQQCASKAKAKIHKERMQAQLLKESEERLAAEESRASKDSTKQGANKIIYSEKCQSDFDCWASSMPGINRASWTCDKLIEDSAKYQAKWLDGSHYPKAYNPKALGKNYHGLVIGYGGSDVLYQNGFGAWRRMNYICWFDTIQNKPIDLYIIER
ncbi:hypothetical protein [Neptuniibacter pectenicola]|uniref:hypothetical protein n=1 Tax=Neptuniibacter pectenicola TaxID=1806669 RepID=UPI000830FA00|nr:hypothetical protein [Neptuniibacter pectenicola]